MGGQAVEPGSGAQPNFLDDALHAATGGLSDKFDAAIQALGVPGGVENGGFSERYHKNLTNIRNKYGEYENDNPGWMGAKGAKAVGVIAPMVVAAPEAAAKTLASAALKGAKTGAVMGAGYGFGGTDDSSVAQDAEATALGATLGGAAGAGSTVGLGIAGSPFKVAGRAAKVFGPKGREVAAGRVLNEAKTSGNAFETPPLPGMQLTTGQSTDDPGLLWLEKSVREATPHGAQLTADAVDANTGAIHTAIGQLGPGGGGDASKAMSDALDRVYKARKEANSAVWKSADVSNTGGVSGFQFNNFIKKYVAGLPIPDRAAIPKDIMDILEQMGQAKTQNLSDVQSVRSMVGSRATMAARASDNNTARILGSDGLAGQIENFIDLKAQNLGAKFPLYNQARADTRAMKEQFQTPPSVRKALGVDNFGADKVPVSATADHFIHSGKGAPEDLQAYLGAISTKDAKTGVVFYDPAGMQAAQDAFTQKFLSTVTNAGQDASGRNLVSPAKMQKFLDAYGHVINSPMFTPTQRDMVKQISRATQMASRTANSRPPGSGSDTFPKLQGDKFIDALIGPGASKIIGGVSKVGGAVAGYLSEGKVGAAAGLFGGKEVAGMISDLYNAPREKVIALITEAMHDPALAQDLMKKASNANAKLIPVPRRAKILGILGAQSTAPATQAITAQ